MQMKTEAGKAHEIKNTAINFGVYGQDAKRLGDIAVTSKGLVWSNGRKSSKDVTVKWSAFIDWMQSQTQTGAKIPTTKAAKSSRAGKPAAAKAKTASSAKSGSRLTASGKQSSARKAAGKINGRSAASARVSTLASPKEKPANKTAH